MASGDPLVSVCGVIKNYHALRPLRLESLTLNRGDLVALAGLDAQAAEILVGLLTGAILPDAGDIQLFGRSTRDVKDSDAWLSLLDGVGIVTDRAVLIAPFTVEQNIGMTITLSVDPISPETQARVRELAEEVGIMPSDLSIRVAEAPPELLARVRVARALALNPSVLLAEHPSATLPRETVESFAADLGRVARARSLAVLAITADAAFAGALGGQTLALDPSTGSYKFKVQSSKLVTKLKKLIS